MRMNISQFGTVALIACASVLGTGCKKEEPQVVATAPAAAVTSALDQKSVSGNLRQATSSTTVPSTRPSLPDFQLFDPNQPEAKPEWGLPAQLSTQDVQHLVKLASKLQEDSTRFGPRLEKYMRFAERLTRDDVINGLFERLSAERYKDQKLPLDYYECFRDDVGLIGEVNRAGLGALVHTGMFVMNRRLEGVKFRLLGGEALVGDVLFVKACQAFLDDRHAHFDRIGPTLVSLPTRIEDEFNLAHGSLLGADAQ